MVRYKWDLYKDGITQTGLCKWMQCREQFYLAYVEGWTAKESSNALDFGTRVHEVLAKARGKADTIPGLIDKMQKKITRDKALTSASRKVLRNRVSVVEVMLRNYFWFWAKQDGKRTWKSREQTFRIQSPKSLDVKGTGFPLRGRRDGIYLSSGKKCIQEIKTGAQIDEQGIHSSLHLRFQPMFYCYTHRQETGEIPHKMMYDLIRRPSLRPRQNEDFGDFLRRLEEDVVEKRPAWYYMRWEISLTECLVMDWYGQVLKNLLRDFSAWYRDVSLGKGRFAFPSHYMNPEALFTKGGAHSDFFEMITRGSSYGLYRRGVPFPELGD